MLNDSTRINVMKLLLSLLLHIGDPLSIKKSANPAD